MFDKFGEFNSSAEINELAENLFNEGDTESLKVMAKENGIQNDFVDMYPQGEIPVLCDQYYSQIKDLRKWEEVNVLSQEYHERYNGDPLADDLLRAYTQEWWRCYGEEAVLDGKESPQ